MKISDLALSDERKEFLKHICNSINPESVTVSDGDWVLTCKELREINRKNIDRVF